MPSYEKPEDLENEKIVAEFLEKKYGYKIKKIQGHKRVDHCVVDGDKILAIIEIKSRHWKISYDSLMIDLGKVQIGIEIGKGLSRPFYIFLYKKNYGTIHRCRVYTPNPGPGKFDTVAYGIGLGGREDRGDPSDKGQMAYIPIGNFKFEGKL
jgi:hypothetical protein